MQCVALPGMAVRRGAQISSEVNLSADTSNVAQQQSFASAPLWLYRETRSFSARVAKSSTIRSTGQGVSSSQWCARI